jgi:hypothetical protein
MPDELTVTVTLPKPWWMLHNEWCPRFGKVTLDASVCSCDEATRKRINEAATQAGPRRAAGEFIVVVRLPRQVYESGVYETREQAEKAASDQWKMNPAAAVQVVPREPSLREKLEAPRVVREILASSSRLVELLDESEWGLPNEVLDVRDELRQKLAQLDEIRTGS